MIAHAVVLEKPRLVGILIVKPIGFIDSRLN